MSYIIHPAEQRGFGDHGWLKTHHSFSFGNFYDRQKVHFGALRVLNDDEIAPGRGFQPHTHENMEIISIPLKGSLLHKDNLGNIIGIREDEIQVMSAGTGIEHSEYNESDKKPASFLQLWIFPNQKNVTPRYDQLSIKQHPGFTNMEPIISPEKEGKGLWLHQNAWISFCSNESNSSTYTYQINAPGNGVYFFMIEGIASIAGNILKRRDAIGFWDENAINIEAKSLFRILVIEIPMDF